MGLGRMAEAARIHRVADDLVTDPNPAAVFYAVELRSLTPKLNDFSIASMTTLLKNLAFSSHKTNICSKMKYQKYLKPPVNFPDQTKSGSCVSQ